MGTWATRPPVIRVLFVLNLATALLELLTAFVAAGPAVALALYSAAVASLEVSALVLAFELSVTLLAALRFLSALGVYALRRWAWPLLLVVALLDATGHAALGLTWLWDGVNVTGLLLLAPALLDLVSVFLLLSKRARQARVE